MFFFNNNQLFFVNTSGISSFHCVILNRWGNLINEIHDVNGAWDGKDKNGDLVTEGTYFYLIDAIKEGGSAVKMYGFVVLKYWFSTKMQEPKEAIAVFTEKRLESVC